MSKYREQYYRTLKRNPNLTVSRYRQYAGLNVQYHKGPNITQYLDRILNRLDRSINNHSEIVVFRFDLHFPGWFDDEDLLDVGENIITRFWESFKSQLKACVRRMQRGGINIEYHAPDYIWCKERNGRGLRCHFHCVLILNQSMYDQLLEYHGGDDPVVCIIKRAWARCLGHSDYEVNGSVYVPDNAMYYVSKNNPEQYADVFYRLSYLAKSSTKWFDDGSQWFGGSRG